MAGPRPGSIPEQEVLPGMEPAVEPTRGEAPPALEPLEDEAYEQESFDREDEDAFFAMEDGGER